MPRWLQCPSCWDQTSIRGGKILIFYPKYEILAIDENWWTIPLTCKLLLDDNKHITSLKVLFSNQIFSVTMKTGPLQKCVNNSHPYHDQVLKRIQMSKNVTGVMVMNQDGMPVIIIVIIITITITIADV